jgi:peptidoglycan/xylan/chitin deacetylase (PgdA/CDA1 family)/heat shock protein HslJ
MKKDTILLFVIIALLLISCQSATPPTADIPVDEETTGQEPTQVAAPEAEIADPAALAADSWQWISFTNPVEQFDVEMPENYILSFSEDGTLDILADCNNASGTYATEGSSLTIEIGPMTMAACPPDSRSDQFVQLLTGAAIYFFEGEDLYIDLMADGGTMAFAPASQDTTVIPTADPAVLHLAGTYRFHPGVAEENFDYILILNQDGTAELDEVPVGSENISQQDAAGTWHPTDDGQGIIFDIQTILGQAAQNEEFIHFTFLDNLPIVSEISVNDQFVHLEDGVFTLGSGDTGPLVGELNRRLAALEYLGFTDPMDDTYGEETRQAVMSFQASQGLPASGVLDARTWVLLDNPQPPLPTPTPAEPITGVPNIDDLPAETEDGRPIVYLTFDDGPDPNNTPQLLDLLDQHQALVTFFNVGNEVETWPDLVRDSATRGHYIADHTWDHHSLEGMTAEQFIQEADRTRDAIIAAAGDLFTLDRNVRYLRPPYGATDANTFQYAFQEGFAIVLWTIDPQDWRRPGADVIANHVLEHVYPGAIILSHDGGGDRSQTIEAYRSILPALQEQGYVFRTIFFP